ncbi:MAG: hypothetical protein NT154_17675 [Verrucomicrobia bacterium]|nr:hypothetical protein [Verrucomicrobiota bacterium]
MQLKKNLTPLLAITILAIGTAVQAADATGTWTWTRPGRNGGADMKLTLKLKADGEKLTGTTVTREFNGNKMVLQYNGKVSADAIKGKIETERNGEAQSRDWEAKRASEAASATGTWSWTRQGRNGGADVKITLKLKAEGEKLTGTLSSPGRNGDTTETAIGDGIAKGDEISFTVTRERNGNKMVTKYNGKVTANAIKGKIESERNGETQSRDWEAKRGTE